MKELSKWKSRLKLRRRSTIVIIVTAFVSVSVVLLTIYGANVGNFVITVEENFQLSLALSENNDFTDPKTMLSAPGIRKLNNSTYEYLPYEIGVLDGGETDDSTYMAYSFYLKNVNDVTIDYNMEISIRNVYKNIDYAMWFMVIKDGERTVYAKPKTDGFGEVLIGSDGKVSPEDAGGHYKDLTVPFKSQVVIAQEKFTGFRPYEVSRFTVIMWLEGHDPECVDEIKGGTMQLDMRFFVVQG